MTRPTMAWIAAALVVSTACGRVGETSEAAPSGAVDAIFAELDRTDGPGAAVLAVRDGAVVFRKGFGMADLEQGIAIDPSTVFDIASVSKQFAGMSIAMLVEQGRVDLEADVRTYLPEMPDLGAVITVDHLVHHTSGLRDWPGTLAVAGWRMDDVISFDQILRMARTQRALNFEPGAEYSYSNTGYNLLAEIVARVSGDSFRAWTQANLFQPLGMDHTHFQDDHTQIVAHRAYGYQPSGDGFVNVPNGLTALGSSSLHTSVDDLAKWMSNFDDPDVGGPEVVALMQRQGVLGDGERIAYAFGQSRGSYRGLETWSHTGSWAGYRTVLVRFPEARFGVVILSNLGSYDPTPAAYRVADELLADRLGPPETDRDDRRVASSVEVPTAVLDAYTGTYRLGPGWRVEITREGGALHAQATNEDRFPMTAVSDTEFFVEAYGASMTFGRGDGGGVDHLTYRGIHAPRVRPVSPGSVALGSYVGAYYSSELDTTYRLRVRNAKLVAEHARHGSIGLTPVLQDEFEGAAWFIPSLEFDRDEQGSVSGFRITQGRSRNLRFERIDEGRPR